LNLGLNISTLRLLVKLSMMGPQFVLTFVHISLVIYSYCSQIILMLLFLVITV